MTETNCFAGREEICHKCANQTLYPGHYAELEYHMFREFQSDPLITQELFFLTQNSVLMA